MAISTPSSIAAGYTLMRNPVIIVKHAFPTPMTAQSLLLAKSMSQRLFFTRSNGAEAGVTMEEEFESETTSPPAEATKGPPSLISAENVEKALRGIAITDADHYARLGLQRLCPYEQVTVAYKKKVEELMASSNLEQEELNKQLELLKESYSILSSVEERRLYDWSLARMDKRGTYSWPFEADITQIPTQIPPPATPEDEGPTRLVGYFMLTWIILSFVLSIVLNR